MIIIIHTKCITMLLATLPVGYKCIENMESPLQLCVILYKAIIIQKGYHA
nr:MAG TPA: hypothetical protein [Caudoviricetes sp.]